MDTTSENGDKTADDKNVQKKEIPPNLQKTCLVCGDKALGYNFNAISCESCKAFFRRNALTNKQFKCPFTNNCAITVVTRRFCQKCRLEKCFEVGMVKEFIMSEEDKAAKRKKIEENRAKKRQLTDTDDNVSSSKNFKCDDELNPSYNQSVQEHSIIQYDVLNSTTCSPSSTVQSPLGNEYDNSINSPPVYNPYTHLQGSESHYVPVQHVDHQYNMVKVYPIDEKSIINRAVYEQRTEDTYNNCDSIEQSTMFPDLSKQNSIRSILTNGDTVTYADPKPQHTCEELPSTSSNDSDVNKARDILQDVERIEPNSMESILCEAIKLEFEAYTSINSCNGSSRELNEVERAKLNELIVASKPHHIPIEEDVSEMIGEAANSPGIKLLPGLQGIFGLTTEIGSLLDRDSRHDPLLIKLVNFTAVAIRRFIKMAKKINAFKNMCEEDQVALLKGGCVEMMILRSTMTFDGQRNHWMIPHNQKEFGTIRADVLKLAKGNIHRLHEAFIGSFDDRCRTDENVILIMSAILLFAPDRPKVVHRDVVKLEQNSYYYLLRRYLESMYPGCEAKSTFLKLIQKIMELRKLAEEITGVYLDVNPIEPLLMEIFDLKHHAA